jgi:hypothetical protein
VTRLKEKLTKLKEEMGKGYEKQMRASPDQQISLTDPDSRSSIFRQSFRVESAKTKRSRKVAAD